MGFFRKKAPEVKINDLIFKELIKRGYSLEGNTRVWNIADSKLWYLTPEQAQGYLDLDSDESYKKDIGQPQGEDLIKENIVEILDKIGDGPINIVDLGCGDGKEAAAIVKEIKKIKPNLKLRYCPIDISGYLVAKAIETFSKLGVDEIVEFQYNISDFENLENVTPLLRIGDFKKNLILLLGNTIGNFEVNELLYEIRTSMEKGDLFLLDTAVNDNKQEQRAQSYSHNKKFNDFLLHVPLQLGLLKEDLEWGTRWRSPRIEFYFTIKNNREIKFQNKTLQFNKGDQIIIAIAYKHDKHDLKTYLNMHFDDVIVKVSKDNSKAIALCKK
jgi:uncharacterized SAM-dependent methyltransferase